MIRTRLTLAVMAAILVARVVPAQEAAGKPTIGKAQLVQVLMQVKGWANQTAAYRLAAVGLDAEARARRADAIRANFDQVMVLMATTDPPAELKQAAVLLLMGAKGVELALWHYIYAAVADHNASLEHGDVLLRTALGQITAAETLFAR